MHRLAIQQRRAPCGALRVKSGWRFRLELEARSEFHLASAALSIANGIPESSEQVGYRRVERETAISEVHAVKEVVSADPQLETLAIAPRHDKRLVHVHGDLAKAGPVMALREPTNPGSVG